MRGLREAAVGAGAKLFEGTRVSSITEGTGPGKRRIRVETPRGRVSAEHCLLATNAYTPELGWLRTHIVPLRVSLFATEPLSAEQRERVGWSGREGTYTAHEILESYRLTADDRIVGGSRYIAYAWGSRIPPDDDPVVFRKLETMFRSRFPELPDVRVERNWSGPIAMSLDFLPSHRPHRQVRQDRLLARLRRPRRRDGEPPRHPRRRHGPPRRARARRPHRPPPHPAAARAVPLARRQGDHRRPRGPRPAHRPPGPATHDDQSNFGR